MPGAAVVAGEVVVEERDDEKHGRVESDRAHYQGHATASAQ